MDEPNMEVKDHPALKPRGLLWEICLKSQNNAEHENTKNLTGEYLTQKSLSLMKLPSSHGIMGYV